MPDEKFTRCPGCQTVFRVTAEQLAIRGGQVRCGHCRTLFDGVDQLISFAPRPFDQDEGVVAEADQGPPTVTLRNYQDVAPPATSADIEAEIDAAAARAEALESIPAMASPPAPPEAGRRRGFATALYGLGAAVLLLAIAAQATFHYRDLLVARWPAARPLLVGMCAMVGCAVRPPREITDLSIQASDLQADPAHKGLLTLTATLRNRGTVGLAYPHLELTLTDAQDRIVVRRALAPGDYAGGTADIAAGIPPNAEVPVKVYIDASATTQAGYRLYLFYP